MAWWDQLVLRWCQNHIKRPSWDLKPPLDAFGYLKQHEMALIWPDGTISVMVVSKSHQQAFLEPDTTCGCCGCLKQHEMAPRVLLGPIDVMVISKLHQQAFSEHVTTCGCLSVPETVWTDTQVAWWDQLSLRWCPNHISKPFWHLKLSVVAVPDTAWTGTKVS